MHLLVDIVIQGGDHSRFNGACSKLVEVDILTSLWYNFEHVEEFLLSQFYELAQLLRTHLLLIGGGMVDLLAHKQLLLVGERLQVALGWLIRACSRPIIHLLLLLLLGCRVH